MALLGEEQGCSRVRGTQGQNNNSTKRKSGWVGEMETSVQEAAGGHRGSVAIISLAPQGLPSWMDGLGHTVQKALLETSNSFP